MTRKLWVVATLALMITSQAHAADPVRVLIWDEQQPVQKQAYANFLGNAIADVLGKKDGITVKSVRLDDPEQGLSDENLDNADVLIWWGHVRHGDVKPEKVKAIVERIKSGKLSLVAIHSAHWSRPFVEAMNERARSDAKALVADKKLSDVTWKEVPYPGGLPKADAVLTPRVEVVQGPAGGNLVTLHLPGCIFPSYRNDGKPSHVTILAPDHPIAKGLPRTFDIPQTEMYADPFHVPKPDVVVLEEKWDKGESFRSGSVWSVGKGKVVYFRPGHETYPILKQPEMLQLLENTVRWLGAK